MFPALLTAFLFACSAIFGQRAAKLFGPLRANAIRLSIACAVLGILTWITDGLQGHSSWHPAVFPSLFLSGAVGFGFGDIGLFLAYPRLGARLTILINFSLATLFAAWGDQALLGEHLTLPQWSGVVLVLAGLGLALWPAGKAGLRARAPWSGLCFAALAGAGQGFGTTLSGWANRLAEQQQVSIHGISQAFQRSTAGVLVAVTVWAVWRKWLKKPAAFSSVSIPVRRKHAGFWMTGAALFGPVAGVSCYQWARLQLPSAVVVAIVATSTLWVIPLAKLIDQDHPTLRQVAGTLVAVAGIAVLYLG
ncbi:MAG: DMT family transporter [Verrucomicrobiota bacterium]